MAKPLEERSDEELKRGLADRECGDKKAVVVRSFAGAKRPKPRI
jgi:hypothetical protein